jgi:hypothetical protein
MPVSGGRPPGHDAGRRGPLYAQSVNTHHDAIAILRLAMAVLAVVAAALVVGQKHLLAQPGPGLVLVLVAGYAAAGLRVDLDADTGLAGVPGDVGLAAYRIAQESLTNAVRHAPGSAASMQVRVTATELRMLVTNDLVADNLVTSNIVPWAPPPGSGHGIAGMTQRAGLAGGTCSARPDGRHWRVEAVFPLGDHLGDHLEDHA